MKPQAVSNSSTARRAWSRSSTFAVAQQVGPRLDRLAVAVDQRDELFAADGKWPCFVTANSTEHRTEFAEAHDEFLELKAKFNQRLQAYPQPRK